MTSTTVLLFLVAASCVSCLSNGVGRRPPMGYNTWYDLKCSDALNEVTIRARAQALVTSGLHDAGFEYVNLDDCIVSHRDARGALVANETRFPSGVPTLSAAVHDLGLKFGVYTDRGDVTCAKKPASRGHVEQDAETYAREWAIDYLKEDSCNATQDHDAAFAEYALMRDALNHTGRPIFFSLCGWEPWYAPRGAALANSWRIGPDDSNWRGILRNIDIMASLSQYAGPGGWNDPCLLLSSAADGSRLVSPLQSRAQFSMWAVLAAPMLISGVLGDQMDAYVLSTYTNRRVIAVSQDVLGRQGLRVAGGNLSHCSGRNLSCGNVWSRTLSGPPGAAALVFLNAAGSARSVQCDAACWSAAGFEASDFPLEATDLWTGGALPTIEGPHLSSAPLAADGGVLMLQVLRAPRPAALPHVDIPPCSVGYGAVSGFARDDIDPHHASERPFPPATQQTRFAACHTAHGLHLHGNATDVDVWSLSERCNDPTYAQGDVLEVFLAPVASHDDDPSWYLELDTSASGVLFGQLSHNARNSHWVNAGGNASTGVSCDTVDAMGVCASPCDAAALGACLFRCDGKAAFARGMNVSVERGRGWWATRLFVPWSLVPSPLARRQTPWPLWRLNFYRYDYHQHTANGSWDHSKYELSAWSASGAANFHLPQWFGTATMR